MARPLNFWRERYRSLSHRHPKAEPQPVISPSCASCSCNSEKKATLCGSKTGGSHPCDRATEEHIVATALLLSKGAHPGPHIAIMEVLYASHRGRRPSLFHVHASAVIVGRASGTGAHGRRGRVGGQFDIQQFMPNLPYDQGRRQSPGSEPTQYIGRKAGSISEGKQALCRTSAIPVL